MILTYILTALVLVTAYLFTLLIPSRGGAFSEGRWHILWVVFAVLLTVLFVRPAYSLWLSLNFWIAPWKPGEGR
jgi:hypothetical protein